MSGGLGSIRVLAAALVLGFAWPGVRAQADGQDGGAGDYAAASRIFEQRCVACHSCYNAPCQLDLTAWEGVMRGASSERVYDGTRLTPAPPTRLFVDAASAAEWHAERGFFPVVEPLSEGEASSSIMARMLAMKGDGPTPVEEREDRWLCPSGDVGMRAYRLVGLDGMPWGFPALSGAKRKALDAWLAAGAPGPAAPAPPVPTPVTNELSAWETFLNGDSVREQTVARYLYEHLFLAHAHVAGSGRHFFRLVRSRTPSGFPIEEIATVRPYDDPGVARVYYRFRHIEQVITHKTHLVFELSPERRGRYRDWFLASPWQHEPTALPAYEEQQAHNPFRVFAAIPAAARYRFMLDNARYFVMSFIRGPVCEGQMAVNVIEDRFQVLFLAPERDLSVTDPGYLERAAPLLELPSAGESDPFDSYYETYKARQREYTAFREARYAETWPGGPSLEAVWDGGGEDPDALLTVFRHFDNASVAHGALGGVPKTVWVLDYPIFERIYYLLVAGFNIYGNAFHQASTRLYMDNLRVEAEDLFLGFLPPGTRANLRAYWYRGDGAREKMREENPLRGADRPTAVRYASDDHKGEWLERVIVRLGGAARTDSEALNAPARASRPPDVETSRDVAGWLRHLTAANLAFVQAMPDVSLLRVTLADRVLTYTLVRDKAHANVSFMFAEAARRLPDEDVLSIVPGFLGSYPNHLFEVDAASLPAFVDRLLGWRVDDDEARAGLFRGFGASRYEDDFWSAYDRAAASFRAGAPVEAGVLDLSKYSYE